MRILIKGGTWKNTEDEILKVAVMKYGKNQWARISSLLTRKSPKQCKARWYEWLDASIKKTEWSKDEDEKLLHLAKLMPTQWRTIAPIVGRTAAQCLERYQKLLDEAEAKEGEQGPTGDDVRRLRPGEIDPDPETKPARPDPVDMDEDEKEMLSEARARLANTQGKKAKRKAREKQLEEARRLAALQKRREMKAAGIDMKFKKPKRGMNYNADIPFYKKAPAGFWDVNEEKEREDREKRGMTNVLLQKLEGKRRADIEENERKKDAKRQKVKKETGEYVPPQARRAAEAMQFSERGKLVLPTPQISDSELEEIVKIGSAGDEAKAVVDNEDHESSRGLLGDYSHEFRVPGSNRTPRTPASGDSLKLQARNLRAMEVAQTPLLGGEVGLTGDVEFNGATPRRNVSMTPNPLAIHATPGGASLVGFATPRVGGPGPGQTPLRDAMRINTPRDSEFGQYHETPRQHQTLIRQQLADHFRALPKPKNDFEIVIPESNPMDTAEDKSEQLQGGEDAADIEDRYLSLKQQAEQARLSRRSLPVQRDLPRPVIVRPEAFDVKGMGVIERMICEEMVGRVVEDAREYPAPGQVPPGFDVERGEEEPSDEELKAAEELVKEEVTGLKPLIHAELAKLDVNVDVDGHEKEWILVRDPDSQDNYGEFISVNAIEPEKHVTYLHQQMTSLRTQMRKEATKAKKLEQKSGIVLGGYMARATRMRRQVLSLWKQVQDAIVSKASFEYLYEIEGVGGPQRVQRMKREVVGLEVREREAQGRWKGLMEEKERLERVVGPLAREDDGQQQGMDVDGSE